MYKRTALNLWSLLLSKGRKKGQNALRPAAIE